MPPYIKITRKYARKYHIPARVLVAQQQTESNFDPNAVSSAGAFGLTQFMPGTATGYHVQRGSSRHAVRTQIRGQAKYLHDLGASHDLKGALAKYAGGPGNPQASYANLVLSRSRKYRGVGNGPAASGGATSSSRSVVKTIPGVNRSGDRKQAIANYLLGQSQPSTQDPFSKGVTDSQNLLNTVLQISQAQDTPATKVRVRQKGRQAGRQATSTDTSAKGTATFEGVRVAAWIKPELEYARQHGWKGKVSSGYRSFADQTRIYNSGVRPAAKPGTSNHEGDKFPRGAVDVTDPQTLSRILSRKGSKLKYAGAKDPVHFSHPHGGSY